jgi:hypothetical protein
LDDAELMKHKQRIFVHIFSDNPEQRYEDRKYVADESWYKILEKPDAPNDVT